MGKYLLGVAAATTFVLCSCASVGHTKTAVRTPKPKTQQRIPNVIGANSPLCVTRQDLDELFTAAERHDQEGVKYLKAHNRCILLHQSYHYSLLTTEMQMLNDPNWMGEIRVRVYLENGKAIVGWTNVGSVGHY